MGTTYKPASTTPISTVRVAEHSSETSFNVFASLAS